MRVERIRGRKLQKIRMRHFTRHPLCVHCAAKGISRLAEELDHIKSLQAGGQDVESNRQGLCKACHEAKTIRDMQYRPRETIGPDGYPVDPECHGEGGE